MTDKTIKIYKIVNNVFEIHFKFLQPTRSKQRCQPLTTYCLFYLGIRTSPITSSMQLDSRASINLDFGCPVFGSFLYPILSMITVNISCIIPGWEAIVLNSRIFSGVTKSSGTILLLFRLSPVRTLALSCSLSTMSWVMPEASVMAAVVTWGATAATAGAAAGAAMPAWGFSVARASRAAVTSLVRRAITLKYFENFFLKLFYYIVFWAFASLCRCVG